MKKVILAGLMIVMLLSATGCGKAKPEDAVKKYFTAAQKLDVKTMSETIVTTNTEDIEKTTTMFDEAKEQDYTKYFVDYLKTMAGKMTYKIKDSEVNEDKAVVTVDCKYVDAGPILKETISQVFSKALEMAFSGSKMSEEETGKLFADVIKEQKDKTDDTYKEATVKIDCVKKDDKWYIAGTNNELLDVVMSGFISAAKEMSDSSIRK